MQLIEIIKKIKRKGLLNSIIFVIITINYNILRKVLMFFFSRSEIKDNYVLFYSFPDYSDNAKVFYDYYRKNYGKYKYIWLLANDANVKDYKEENTIFVKAESKFHNGKTLKALYYISKCKFIYFTHKRVIDDLSTNRKKGQIVINLWHGCGYKENEKKNSNKKDFIFDYVLVPGKVFINTKSKFWNCQEDKILDIGYPRYDLYFEDNIKTSNFVKELKKENIKFVIWMPTFRKTYRNYFPEEKIHNSFDLPLLQSEKELLELNDLCKNNKIMLCIKRHPMQIKYQCENLYLSNIIFISNNDLVNKKIDLYSLLKYTDGLITDYSSIAIDYLLLDKPIAFILNDYEEYKNARGFVFENPLEYMPGYHIYTFQDVITYIQDVGNNIDLYLKKRKDIMCEVHNPCDNYCERIFKKVMELGEEHQDA